MLTHLPGSADLDRPAALPLLPAHLGTLKRKVCQLRAEISISRTYLNDQSRDPASGLSSMWEPCGITPLFFPTLGIGLGEVGPS